MNNIEQNTYKPTIAFHPGTMLEEKLEEMGVTAEQFAEMTDIPVRVINNVITETNSVSADMAIAFEQVTNIPAKMWLRMQHLYDDYIVTEQKSTFRSRLDQLKKVAAVLL